MYVCVYIYIYIYRRLGGESNREIVSFRCVRAGEAKLRGVCLSSLGLKIGLVWPGRAGSRLSPQVFYFSVRTKWF